MSKKNKFAQSGRTNNALHQQPEESTDLEAIDKAIYDGDEGGIDWGQIAQKAQNKIARASNGQIAIGGFTLTQKGAIWDEAAAPTEDNWKEALSITFRMESGLQWIIGDLIAFGETVGYGDAQGVGELFERKPQTLYNYASICRAFPEISRRRENLSFGHHDAVSGIKNLKQRENLLDQAAQEEWSVARLRQEASEQKSDTESQIDKDALKVQRKRMNSIIKFMTQAKTGELDSKKREEALGEIAAARQWLDKAEAEIANTE